MDLMCNFANHHGSEGFLHPVLRSIALHFWLAYDHPFVDGNGRVARALFYWSMLRHDFWLFEFISISPLIRKALTQYHRAFALTETDENDLTYFMLYHLEILRKSIEELHRYIERKSRETREAERRLGGMRHLNHRQRAFISHALRHPGGEYTIEGHRRSHDVVYQTARADLLDLEARGLLRSKKIGKRMYFTVVPDLERRLAR